MQTKIYIIIEANAYDAFELPQEQFYLTESEAEAACLKLNKAHNGENKKYYSFDVHELTLSTK